MLVSQTNNIGALISARYLANNNFICKYMFHVKHSMRVLSVLYAFKLIDKVINTSMFITRNNFYVSYETLMD